MGGTCTRDERRAAPMRSFEPVPVTLHIYNLGGKTQAVNSILRKLGTGAFHCGVEVYGVEWSFSDVYREGEKRQNETGIFCCTPRQCEGHSYCESIPMGVTTLPESAVMNLLFKLKQEWRVDNYNTLRKNCCHFCDSFCQRLGVGSIPHWVKNLASAGAALISAGDVVCCHAMGQSPAAMMFCCGHADRPGPGFSEVVNADVVQSLPVLPPFRGTSLQQSSDPLDKGDGLSAMRMLDPWDVPTERQPAAQRTS